MNIEKLWEKVRKDKEELAASYGVDASAVVYIGDNKYIVCFGDGQEARV